VTGRLSRGTLYPTYAQTDSEPAPDADTCALSVYANNVTDRRGVIGGGWYDQSARVQLLQPRTVGPVVASLSDAGALVSSSCCSRLQRSRCSYARFP